MLKYIPNDLIFFSDGSIEFDNKLGIIVFFKKTKFMCEKGFLKQKI